MIFQTVALASLLYSASALTTEGVTTTNSAISKAALKKELKAKLREKLAVPSSMSAKMEKFSKLKPKASTINLETTTFDETRVNLRGLKMKDNFWSITGFMDDQCSTPSLQFGTLVNYCMDEQGTESGVKKSYITKVNKKENLVVEIEYDGYGCKGIPSKVSNMLYEVEPGAGFGGCFAGPDDMYYTMDYLSTYPDLGSMPGMYVSRTYPEDMCSSDNMNYVEYNQMPLEMMGIPLEECIPYGPGVYLMYTATTCAATGQLTINGYDDAACTNLVASDTVFDNNCMSDDDDDDDDDDDSADDDDDDDDDYELTGVIDNEFCT